MTTLSIADGLHQGINPLTSSSVQKSREDVLTFELFDAIVYICEKHGWNAGGGTKPVIDEDGKKYLDLHMILYPNKEDDKL